MMVVNGMKQCGVEMKKFEKFWFNENKKYWLKFTAFIRPLVNCVGNLIGFFIKEKCKTTGKVRLIECDGLKYPSEKDVDIAIKNGDAIISPWISNLIPTVGRTAIARRLRNAGTKVNEGIITYGAVGTDSTPALNSNTQLVNEIFRKLLSTTYNTDNVVRLRVFLTTSQGNGTLREYGLFGEDATGVANSGTLFERVIINKVKTTAKTLTIESMITIS